jgi:hypothetical protein
MAPCAQAATPREEMEHKKGTQKSKKPLFKAAWNSPCTTN